MSFLNITLPRLALRSCTFFLTTHTSFISFFTSLHTHTQVKSADENNQEIPFTFLPSEGCIPAEAEEVITIRFAPMDAKRFEATAECIAEGLTDNTSPLLITLNGFGKRPVCHFDVEPSHYLEDRMHLGREEEAAATAGATSAGMYLNKELQTTDDYF